MIILMPAIFVCTYKVANLSCANHKVTQTKSEFYLCTIIFILINREFPIVLSNLIGYSNYFNRSEGLNKWSIFLCWIFLKERLMVKSIRTQVSRGQRRPIISGPTWMCAIFAKVTRVSWGRRDVNVWHWRRVWRPVSAWSPTGCRHPRRAALIADRR